MVGFLQKHAVHLQPTYQSESALTETMSKEWWAGSNFPPLQAPMANEQVHLIRFDFVVLFFLLSSLPEDIDLVSFHGNICLYFLLATNFAHKIAEGFNVKIVFVPHSGLSLQLGPEIFVCIAIALIFMNHKDSG